MNYNINISLNSHVSKKKKKKASNDEENYRMKPK